ncbi:MAG TPA: hypothetical protein VE998_03010 [Terriglobales bacterium]|nr:hypothetical protein [Terriglobales bacterium]
MNTASIISHLKAERERISRAIIALEELGAPGPGSAHAATRRHGSRHMSAEARKRISDAMRRRWAERKKK